MRLFLLLLPFALFACKKKNCDDPANIQIMTNGPVVRGWSLKLETNQIPGNVVWSGPNNWLVDHTGVMSNQNYLEVIPNVSAANSGTYEVKIYNTEGCLTHQGSVDVQVIAPPPPPCTVTPNSSTSSLIGVAGQNFYSTDFRPINSWFYVDGYSGGNTAVELAFNGTARPRDGVWEITDGYLGLDPGEVGLHVAVGLQHFLAQGGQVYVNTNAAGKMTVGFCNIRFSNPINPGMPVTISANIVQP